MAKYTEGDYIINITGGKLTITPQVKNGADIITFGVAGATITLNRADIISGTIPPTLRALIPESLNYDNYSLVMGQLDFSMGACYEAYDGETTVEVDVPSGSTGKIKKKVLTNYRQFFHASTDEHSFVEEYVKIGRGDYPVEIKNIDNIAHNAHIHYIELNGSKELMMLILNRDSGEFVSPMELFKVFSDRYTDGYLQLANNNGSYGFNNTKYLISMDKQNQIIEALNTEISGFIGASFIKDGGDPIKAIEFITEGEKSLHIRFSNGRTAIIADINKPKAKLTDFKRVIRLTRATDIFGRVGAIEAPATVAIGDNGVLAYGAQPTNRTSGNIVKSDIDFYNAKANFKHLVVVNGGNGLKIGGRLAERLSGGGGSSSSGSKNYKSNKATVRKCKNPHMVPYPNANTVNYIKQIVTSADINFVPYVYIPPIANKFTDKSIIRRATDFPINNNSGTSQYTTSKITLTSTQEKVSMWDNFFDGTDEEQRVFFGSLDIQSRYTMQRASIVLSVAYTKDGEPRLHEDMETGEVPKVIASKNIPYGYRLGCGDNEYAPAIK